MKVLFCASEVFPFAKTGGLADVSGSLPPELAKQDVQIKVVMPRYRTVSDEEFEIEEINNQFSRAKLSDNVTIYFVEQPEYFDRDGLYGDEQGDYTDNLARYRFFCQRVFKLMKTLDWQADIIHCHDWHTALIPVLLKNKYHDDPFFQGVRTVLTVHNLAFQGLFALEEYPQLDLPDTLLSDEGFLFYEKVNLLKAGILSADAITTVSPQYAREIQTPQHGCGLEKELERRGVTGILNGLDYTYWNPEADPYLIKSYNTQTRLEGKLENKIGLMKSVGLKMDIDRPLYGFVGRISHQKGMELIIEAIKTLKSDDLAMVIQGQGDPDYQEQLQILSDDANQNLSVIFDYDERLAHMIYAGSDWFMMPSQFEPCGLTQMISMRYGTPPIVFRTGGLADTVEPFSADTHRGNGLMYAENSAEALVEEIRRAAKIFGNKKDYYQVAANAMETRFPWTESAAQYKQLYECLLSD